MIRAMALAVGLLASVTTAVARASDFVQGLNFHRPVVAGRVIGWSVGGCVVLIVDQPGRPGVAGGGRLVLCETTLGMDDRFQGPVWQTGTRMLRVGPGMRVVPVVEPVA